ncbi:UNVERIFIED_CONTAM: hypothetical protein K2H54_063981, partial [Gekko kuhli]
VQEEITQECYPGATFPGGVMKPDIYNSPSLCDRSSAVKPEQVSVGLQILTRTSP